MAHLLPQHGRAVLGQPLSELGQPSHEADDRSTHCEGMHAKFHRARFAAGVDCQPKVALPAGCLENLQRAQGALLLTLPCLEAGDLDQMAGIVANPGRNKPRAFTWLVLPADNKGYRPDLRCSHARSLGLKGGFVTDITHLDITTSGIGKASCIAWPRSAAQLPCSPLVAMMRTSKPFQAFAR